MSESTTNGSSANGNGAADSSGAARSFALEQLYIKDLSFESPNAPQVFQQAGIEPETELNIRNAHQVLDNQRYEVVLHLRIHSQQNDNTIFLIELEQAGVFKVEGYSDEQTTVLLGTQCPATLFPYARETVSGLVGKGGFPPLILQPINFEALFARAREQQQQQDAQA